MFAIKINKSTDSKLFGILFPKRVDLLPTLLEGPAFMCSSKKKHSIDIFFCFVRPLLVFSTNPIQKPEWGSKSVTYGHIDRQAKNNLVSNIG